VSALSTHKAVRLVLAPRLGERGPVQPSNDQCIFREPPRCSA